MSTPDSPPGISYQASLPLEWLPADDIPAATAALWQQGNLAVLHALATLEAAAPEKEAGDAEPATQKAVERLEAKLDVALTLLSSLMLERVPLPAEIPVTLSVGSIAWQAGQDAPSPGKRLRLRLFLSPRLPQPLQFLVRVACVEHGVCQAELLNLDSEMEEWLTRTLFRYHRRALQARHHA